MAVPVDINAILSQVGTTSSLLGGAEPGYGNEQVPPGKTDFDLLMEKLFKQGKSGKLGMKGMEYAQAPDMSQFANVGSITGILGSMGQPQPKQPVGQMPMPLMGLLGG